VHVHDCSGAELFPEPDTLKIRYSSEKAFRKALKTAPKKKDQSREKAKK